MSGGGIGQIVNAINLDEKHEEIIIHAGNNEILNTRTPEEFVYTVEKTREKLSELAKQEKITLVLPLVPPTGAFETAKAVYLEKKMEELSSIKTVKLESVEYDHGHPTEKGTADIIKQLNATFSSEIILQQAEEADITTSKKYSNVKAIYKTGCRGCAIEEYTSYLCRTCIDLAKDVDASVLRKMTDEIHDQMFPKDLDLRSTMEEDVEMIRVRKRELSTSQEHDENVEPKNARSKAK